MIEKSKFNLLEESPKKLLIYADDDEFCVTVALLAKKKNSIIYLIINTLSLISCWFDKFLEQQQLIMLGL
jgi:hypothetical protein